MWYVRMVNGFDNHNNVRRINFGIVTRQLAILQLMLMSALAVPDTNRVQTHRLHPSLNLTVSHVDITNAFMDLATSRQIVINTATIVMNGTSAAIVIKVLLATTVISI